ncbi:MAG: hypothetical protein BWY59_01576 [Verrucomicrobia bacterium ADurb.Bin345]|nr:MAG: hypothetical protein BWY59_01576 [Verrucomicrobia bacterium ADurb.Bin345]
MDSLKSMLKPRTVAAAAMLVTAYFPLPSLAAGTPSGDGSCTSDAKPVCMLACDSLLWKTLNTPFTQSIAIPWPADASASATATITVSGTGDSKSVTCSRSTDTVAYAIPSNERSERAWTLTMAITDGGDTLATYSAEIGLVRGCSNGAPMRLRGPAMPADAWLKTESPSLVFRKDAGDASFTASGAATANLSLGSELGWYALYPIAKGEVEMSLVDDAGVASGVTILRTPISMVIILL